MFLWKNEKEIFKSFINKKGLKKNKKIRELYEKVRDEYENKISNNLIDIKAEKIRLEDNIGKYYSFYENLFLSTIISIISATLVSIYFKGIVDNIVKGVPENYKLFALMVFTVFIIVIVMICFFIPFLTSSKKRNVYNICLKALEDIEKDIEANKNKRHEKIKQKTLYDLKLEIKNLNNSLMNIYNANKEIASDSSNKITEGIDLINKKVEDLKKFHDIK